VCVCVCVCIIFIFIFQNLSTKCNQDLLEYVDTKPKSEFGTCGYILRFNENVLLHNYGVGLTYKVTSQPLLCQF
jgi:hypothetical protein